MNNMINNSTSRYHSMFLLFAILVCFVQHSDCRLHGKTVDDRQHREQNNDQTKKELQSGQWYVDWNRRQCVQGCDLDSDHPSCGGRLDDQSELVDLFDSAEECCADSPIFYLSLNECTFGAIIEDDSNRSPGYDPTTFGIEKRRDTRKNTKRNKNKKHFTKRIERLPNKNKIGTLSDGIYTLHPVNDAFIDHYNPSQNYDINTLQTNYCIDTLLQFELPDSLEDNNLIEATLELYTLEPCAGKPKIEVVSGDWSEKKVTWNNAPSKTGPKSTETRVKQNQLRKNTPVEVDVTNAVEWSTKVKHDDYITFRVSVPEEADGCLFASKENSNSKAPSLELRLGDENDKLKQNSEPCSKNLKKNKKQIESVENVSNVMINSKPHSTEPYTKPRPKKQNPLNQKPSNPMLNSKPRPPPRAPTPKPRPQVSKPKQQPQRPVSVVRFAKRNQPCDAFFSADACYDVGYMCIGDNGLELRGSGIGICRMVERFANMNQPCNAFFGANACYDAGYVCIGDNGLELRGSGMGICRPIVRPNTNEVAVGRFASSYQPCNAFFGTDACYDDGYVCIGDNDLELRGSGMGTCRLIVRPNTQEVVVNRFANRNQPCDAFFGVQACNESGYMCIGDNGLVLRGSGMGTCRLTVAPIRSEGQVCQLEHYLHGQSECVQGLVCYGAYGATFGPGICKRINKFAWENQACNASYGGEACAYADMVCTGPDRLQISGIGVGVCVHS